MANPSKAKGTATETAVTRWLRDNGFPTAERRALSGNQDKGDILAGPGLIFEVKSRRGAAGHGQPGPAELAAWMRQASKEREWARADLCPLVVKRVGTTDVGRWFVYVTVAELAYLMDSTLDVVLARPAAPVCMTVADLVAVLRAVGYGDDLGGAA